MEEEIEKYYPALRRYVEKHKKLRSYTKFFVVLLVITFVPGIVFPPLMLVCSGILLIWAAIWFKLGGARCPRCSKKFLSLRARIFTFHGGGLMPGYLTCHSCGLRVCDLPEIECRYEQSHTNEWL